MSTTPHLGLPYLAAGQAQKHVTLNEALRMLDALVQLRVIAPTLTSPPASPVEGDNYIVPTGATGAWSGHGESLAAWQDGGWSFFSAQSGWRAFVVDEDGFRIFRQGAWIVEDALLEQVDMLGINMAADTSKRLSVSSATTLLNHQGAGHRLVLNKAAQAETASVLLQSGFSGRAEIGLCGNNQLAIKYSTDGTVWTTGLLLSASGKVGIGTSVPAEKLDVVGNIHASGTLDSGSGNNRIVISPGSIEMSSDVYGPYFDWKQSASQDYLWRTMLSGSNFEFVARDGATDRYPLRLSNKGAIMLHDTWVGAAGQVMVTAGDINQPARWKSISEVRFANYSKAGLPSAVTLGAGAVIYVSDESGGAVLAFSDGSAWRRVTDRAVVS